MKIAASPYTFSLGIAIFLGLLPLGIYHLELGGVPTIHPAAALQLLSVPGGAAALVDVRKPPDFAERHIAGALSLPLSRILEMDSAENLDVEFRERTLILVCDVGVQSAEAARHLSRLGLPAYTVRGGMQDWGRAYPMFTSIPSSRFMLAGGTVQEPTREMPAWEQAAAAVAMLWIKPTYMLLSALVGYLLLRQRAADVRLLGWGLLIFLVGEIFCAINYLFFKDNSYFAEYMHSYSMAVAFGLAAYALLEGLDERVLHFSQADRRCAMLPVCGECTKYKPVRCGVKRLSQLSCFSFLILAFIPLGSPFSLVSYNTRIFGFVHYYTRPAVHQWFEARYSPFTAVFLILLALLVMQFTPRSSFHPLARLLLCGGAGFLGFVLFRVALGMIFAETLVWAVFWEELTEFMFVGAVIFILWVFRLTLLPGFNPVKALRRIFP